MNEAKVTRTVTVANRAGLHARSALLVANCVRKYQAKVALISGRERVDATDMLQMLSLGAAQGQALVLEAAGPQAQEAMDALVELFAAKFHEDA